MSTTHEYKSPWAHASRPTKAQLHKPFRLTCAKCGGQATAYAYPMPKGSVYCPTCSPVWLKSFLEFATSKRDAKYLATDVTIISKEQEKR